MFYRSILAISLAFVGISGAQAASDSKEAFPLNAESTAQFREQAATLRNEMDKGKYSELPRGDKRAIDKRLDELDALYVKRSTGAKIDDGDAVALVNASSEINSLLAGNSDEKLICEQVKILGSNRRTKVCTTEAERKSRHRADQKEMTDLGRPEGRSGN
ncbi:MAG: hypothetical protein WBP11_01355 [Dokdonella sp.]